ASRLRSIANQTLGGALPEVRYGAYACSNHRSQTAAVYVGIRAVEKRSGRDVLALRPHLRSAGGGIALFQHLRHAPGAVESIHGRGGNLCFAPTQPAGAASVR